MANFFQLKPSWFIPKPVEQYEVWVYADNPQSNFKIFIDKQSGDIFLSDFQV